MLGDTFGITYNAVAKTLKKVNQDNFGATYYLDDSANDMAFNAAVKHTIPPRGKEGESHLVRLDVDHLDSADGALLRTTSAWIVMKTFVSVQDITDTGHAVDALTLWASSANMALVAGRES